MAKRLSSPVDVKRNFRPKVKAKNRPASADKGPAKEIAVFDPDAVELVLDALPDQERVAAAADKLSGLAHPNRLIAMVALSTAELCVGDIAAVLGLSLSATSTMLKQLRALGFLSTRHAGKQMYYRATEQAPRAVMDLVLAPTKGARGAA
jgi:ArsR family transcriptional regulator, lead/cadmium/zinc/bismuth-responsive transcriptional repressor